MRGAKPLSCFKIREGKVTVGIDDINNELGFELFLPQLSGIEKRFISSEEFYTNDIETTFNIHLKKNYILSKIYRSILHKINLFIL